MKFSKKGLEIGFMTMAIIAFVSLFLIFQFFSNLSGASDSSDNLACSNLFSQGMNSGAFYSKDLTNFNQRFFDFTESKCSSFNLDVDNKAQDILVKKISSCWEKLNSGELILPRGMFGEGICYYCGEINVDSSFDSKSFQKKLGEKEKDLTNMFENSNLESGNYGVFYYQYRESLDTIDSIGNFIDSSISEYGGLLSKYSDVFNPDVEVYSGITFAEIKKVQKKDPITNEDIETNAFYLENSPFNEKLNCRTIIPRD